jgi:L-ascorbate metabolism protein UlaG (beta-lactamase superfamily)
MQLTHFGHACVLLETDSARLLIDPGTLSSDFESLRDLDAVLITHQHADHLDVSKLPALLAANANAVLFADPGSAPALRDAGLTVQVLVPGENAKVAGASIDVVGGEHAVVHPDIPVVPNGAFVVDDGAFFHPGDSFFVPTQDVDVLGLPVSGPWVKVGEAIDYVRLVSPRVAVPIHERALSNTGSAYSMLAALKPAQTTFRPVEHAISTGV